MSLHVPLLDTDIQSLTVSSSVKQIVRFNCLSQDLFLVKKLILMYTIVTDTVVTFSVKKVYRHYRSDKESQPINESSNYFSSICFYLFSVIQVLVRYVFIHDYMIYSLQLQALATMLITTTNHKILQLLHYCHKQKKNILHNSAKIVTKVNVFSEKEVSWRSIEGLVRLQGKT